MADKPRPAVEDIQNPTKAGWLTKQGAIVQNWQRRWFVLDRDWLHYYKDKTSGSPKGSIHLRTCNGVRRAEGSNRPNCFVITTPQRTYYCVADTQEEMEEWLRAIGKGIVMATTTEWDDTSDRLDEAQQ